MSHRSSFRLSRRHLLQAGGATAVLSMVPWRVRAQGTPPPLLITVEAFNAWDPTTHLDPHVNAAFTPYRNAEIRTVSGLRIAPRFNDDGLVDGGQHLVARVGGGQVDFWTEHAAKLRVFNGVNHESAVHQAGQRFAFTGNIREGSPSLGALLAVTEERRIGTLPLPFVSNGGTDASAGLLAVSRMPNQTVLQRAASPAQIGDRRSMASTTEALVREYQRRNDEALLAAAAGKPAWRREMQRLLAGRTTQPAFETLGASVEARLVPEASALTATAAVVLSAMAVPDTCAAAHLSIGSFDTHADHNNLHPAKLNQLLQSLDYLIHELETAPDLQELTSTRGVIIYVASDFARTRYNNGDEDADAAIVGKDHWPITSSFVIGLGAASSLVTPGVVGETRVVNDAGVAMTGTQAKNLRIVGGRLVAVDSFADAPSDSFAFNAGDVMAGLRAAVLPADAQELGTFPLLENNPSLLAAISGGSNPVLRDG